MTTTPISAQKSPANVDAVYADGDASDHAVIPAASAREEWARFAAFLRRPRLPDTASQAQHGWAGTLRMLGLDLAIMAAFITALMGIVAAGVELPENLNSTLEMNLNTVLLVVVLAPILEELIFRSWLSGRPRYLVAFPVFLGAALVAALAAGSTDGDTATALGGAAMLLGLLVTLIAAIMLWKRETPRWFHTIFPAAFWLSSLGFALIHLLNYTEGALLVLLPLVIPQMILGTMAAYVRVHYGLIFAILLHALHNGFAFGVAALAMTAEGAG